MLSRKVFRCFFRPRFFSGPRAATRHKPRGRLCLLRPSARLLNQYLSTGLAKLKSKAFRTICATAAGACNPTFIAVQSLCAACRFNNVWSIRDKPISVVIYAAGVRLVERAHYAPRAKCLDANWFWLIHISNNRAPDKSAPNRHVPSLRYKITTRPEHVCGITWDTCTDFTYIIKRGAAARASIPRVRARELRA